MARVWAALCRQSGKVPFGVPKTIRWLSALLVGLALAAMAWGQPPKASPGVLVARADAAFKAGRFKQALAGYDTAEQAGAGPAATLGACRSLVELGSWLAAERRYRDVLQRLRPPHNPDAGSRPSAARASLLGAATDEYVKLVADVPRLRLSFNGAPPAEVALTIDEQVFAASTFAPSGAFPKGKALRLDPGEHRIVARHKQQTRSFSLRLHPGTLREYSVRFSRRQTRTQRKCRDECRAECRGKGRNSPCYLGCKQRCFRH